MTSRRDEILRATSEAARVAERFPTGNRTSFDIVGAVTQLDIPLMFQPLRGLWGATVTVDDDKQGILVTSRLDLQVQRFTLAHELGHIRLGHKVSFDETIGFDGRFGSQSRPTEEVAADTFASELLGAKPLMRRVARNHGWTKSALEDPTNVYQLGIRLGISFPATCWALATHNVLTQGKARALQTKKVKELKLALVPGELLANPWANVWKLTPADSGTYLEAGPDDVFAMYLDDNSSAGYVWQLVDTGSSAKILDEQQRSPSLMFGSKNARVVYLKFEQPGVHQLVFSHQRPWNKQEMATIDIAIEGYGKEHGGFARRAREAVVAGAA